MDDYLRRQEKEQQARYEKSRHMNKYTETQEMKLWLQIDHYFPVESVSLNKFLCCWMSYLNRRQGT